MPTPTSSSARSRRRQDKTGVRASAPRRGGRLGPHGDALLLALRGLDHHRGPLFLCRDAYYRRLWRPVSDHRRNADFHDRLTGVAADVRRRALVDFESTDPDSSPPDGNMCSCPWRPPESAVDVARSSLSMISRGDERRRASVTHSADHADRHTARSTMRRIASAISSKRHP
jgi:hypothetical protein